MDVDSRDECRIMGANSADSFSPRGSNTFSRAAADISMNHPWSRGIDETGTFVQMMIPGNKVGLIIGKGGERIKQLQGQSGAKLNIIQASSKQLHLRFLLFLVL